MTLSLEQVRQTRFHLARRNGYEPVDVDNFVDKVEVTLAQLSEENETLKQQVDALAGGEGVGSGDSAEADDLRRQLAEAKAEADRLRDELETTRNTLAEGDSGAALSQAQTDLDAVRTELNGRDERISALEAELAGVREELSGAQAAAVERTGKVENIVVTAAPDAAPAVTKLLQMATEQAERLVSEAETEAQRITDEASRNAEAANETAAGEAHETLSGARTRAEQIETQARAGADALAAETQAKAEALNTEIEQRRVELFSALETERDELRGKVDHLRSFEQRYRQSLTTQLQAHLESLSDRAEPDDAPDVLDEPAAPSATPRLDALLNDQS